MTLKELQVITYKIKNEIEKNKIRIISFLKELIQIPSLSGEEKQLSLRIKKELLLSGINKIKIDSFGNLICRIGKKRPRILYDAHMDTISPGEIKNWFFYPYDAKTIKNQIFGRGACDDKGSIAAMLYSMKVLKSLNLDTDFQLYFSATVKEETGEASGMDFIFKEGQVSPDYVMIGEPSNLKIIKGHKGRVGVKINIKGKSLHASTPAKSKNPIFTMCSIVKRIESLNSSYRENTYLGKPSITVTEIKSKSPSLNTTPSECSIFIDRRTTEKENKQTVIKELKDCIKEKVKITVTQSFMPAWTISNDHILIKSAITTYKMMFNRFPKIDVWSFCSNGSITCGKKRIPTIGFGPGNPMFAHKPNERISKNEVIKATMFYSLFPFVLTFMKKHISNRSA